MKLFSKLLAVLMVFSIFVSGIQVNAASRDIPKEAYRLEKLGFLDAADISANQAQMSKAVFVKTAVTMYLSNNDAPYYAEMSFKDVNRGGFASNEIQFALKAGLIDSAEYFYPEAAISYDEAVKIMVRVLGYGIVAESEGYPSAAAKAKILKGVNSKFELKDALTLLDNALESPLMKPVSYGDNQKSTIDKDSTLLTQSGIDMKRVEITNVDVLESKIEVNGRAYFTENIDLAAIPEGEAEIYIRNSDDVVIYIDVLGDTKILYDFIEYINDKESKDGIYPSDIKKISLRNSGETFNVEDDAKITLNETSSFGNYINTFAKIITKNNKIAKVEAYSLRVGGLIYRADPQKIKYHTGKMAENVISGFDKLEELDIYVDGVRSSNMLDLKAEMVFDYWCNEKQTKFIIVASSRTVEGRFESCNPNSIFVDGIEYEINETNKLIAQSYLSKKYSDNEDYSKFLSNVVKIYIDDNKYVRFMDIDESLSEIDEFYGVVLGVRSSSVWGDEYEVKVHKITGGSGEAIYKTASKLNPDSLSMDYVASVAKDYDARGFLKFTLNSKDEIKKVEVPDYWGAIATTNDIEDETTARISGVPLKKATMFALLEIDGEFTVKHVTWENLRGTRTANWSDMTIVSDFDIRNNPLPKFVALTKNCEYLCSYYTTLDVLKEIRQLPDDMSQLVFAAGSEYIVPNKFVTENKLTNRCFMRFRGKMLGENPLTLNPSTDVFDMSGEPETWKTEEYSPERTSGFFKMDSIRFRDENVIQFETAGEPSEVYFLDEWQLVYEYNRRTGKLERSSVENISKGYPVWYYVAEWPSPKGVQVIIYESTSMAPETDE